jgi:type IV secretory pathway TrbL component
VFVVGGVLVGQVVGGQQAQVGKIGALEGEKSAPRSSNGSRKGLRRMWKALGKKAKMKIARKMHEFRKLGSNGIDVGECEMIQ